MFNQSRPVRRALRTLAAPVVIATAIASAGPVAAASAATAASPKCEAWTGEPPNSPGTVDNTFTSVAVLSPCNAWAVGFDVFGTIDQTLIEHWNGATWTTVQSPDPGTNGNILKSVRAVSASDIWAVGNLVSAGEEQTLTLHFNGKSWTPVPSISVPGDFSGLNSVRAVSSTNVWAVGQSFNQATGFRTLIEHWDGQAWKQVLSPNGPNGTGAALNSVTFTSATSGWAVGQTFGTTINHTFVLHWNGKNWSPQKSPTPDNNDALWSVAASSSQDVWAVGANSADTKTLILHFNGTQWSVVSSPNPAGGPGNANAFRGVTVTSASNAVAVGFTARGPMIAQWNGTRWSSVRSPAGIELDAVAASSASNFWAVGNSLQSSVRQTLAVHCC